jgi:hypothetical protein
MLWKSGKIKLELSESILEDGENENGAYKKEKKEIISKLDELDKKAEVTMLAPHEVDIKHCLNTRLIQLL